MYGSIIVQKCILERLLAVPLIGDSVGENPDWTERIVASPVTTQRIGYPVILYYSEQGDYTDGRLQRGARIDQEQLRFVLKAQCEGEDVEPILPLAETFIETFDGKTLSVSYNGDTFDLTFTATGEVPMNQLVVGEDFYQQLGVFLNIHLIKR